MTQSPYHELFKSVKSVVLDGEENEIPVTLISSHPRLLINQKRKTNKFRK